MTAGANLVDQALRQINPKADLQAIIWYVSSGVWRLLLNYLFTMLIRTLFFALPVLAIATSGYAQVPAPLANPAPIESSRKLVPAQSVAAAKTAVGTPSESPSPSAT